MAHKETCFFNYYRQLIESFMNKNILRFVLPILVFVLLLSGCQRLQKKTQDLNQNETSAPTSVVPGMPAQPAQSQPTQQQLNGSSAASSAAQPTVQPTKAPAAPQTNSSTPSESDKLLNDLDSSLNDLGNSLNSVDTINNIP
jgi:hypothetical protein